MAADLGRLRVLVVEDNPTVRTLMRGQFQVLGIDDVIEARDGISALEILSRRTVDVVVTDLAMKPMDGIEFTQRLRIEAGPSNFNVPVLMISGHTDRESIQKALDAGVAQFLAKPFTSKALGERLASLADDKGCRVSSGFDRRRVYSQSYAQRRKSDRQGS
jgi:two-component system, chemotaxis family, chemotaxis protein CheY